MRELSGLRDVTADDQLRYAVTRGDLDLRHERYQAQRNRRQITTGQPPILAAFCGGKELVQPVRKKGNDQGHLLRPAFRCDGSGNMLRVSRAGLESGQQTIAPLAVWPQIWMLFLTSSRQVA